MNCRQARELLAQKIEGNPPLPELERHLQRCPGCRDWNARQQRTVHHLARLGTLPPAADLSRQVLDRLPDMSPAALAQTRAVVGRAWQEPDLREALRAAPQETLAREGVTLPAGIQVVVVPPEEATLPGREVLALPLPHPGEGPRSADEMRARLRPTPAAPWIEPELVCQAPGDPAGDGRQQVAILLDRVRLAGEGFLSGLRRPGPRRLLAPALAVAAALLVLFGLLATLQQQVTATPGAAAGSWPWAATAGLVVLVAVGVVLILWRRK